MRNRIKVFLLLGCLMVITLGCGAGAAFPPSEAGAPEPRSTQLTPITEATQPAPAVLEARRLTLEWPPSIRNGDSDIVKLTLDIDAQGNLESTAEFAGHKTHGEIVQIPDLYDTHDIWAEARFEIAGLTVVPPDMVSEPLLKGFPVSFSWSVRPQEVGDFRGTVWLSLRFVPKAGGPETHRTLTAQTVEIRSLNLLGLGGAPARWLGSIGALIGSVFGLDGILEWIWKKIIKRESGKA